MIIYYQGDIMANKVSTNISLDPEIKRKAVELFQSVGLDLSTAISLFLSQSIREGKIPFEIKLVPNKETIDAIKETEYMELHPDESESFDSVDELMEDLKN